MSGDRSTPSKVMASTLNPRLPGNSFAREVGGFVYSKLLRQAESHSFVPFSYQATMQFSHSSHR